MPSVSMTQCVGQAGQLQQTREIGIGARQARDLQAKNGAHLAQAHPTDHLPESSASLGGAARDPQIGVDDFDLCGRPAQLSRLLHQRVLACL